jgi:predicted kinase/plastocyanin
MLKWQGALRREVPPMKIKKSISRKAAIAIMEKADHKPKVEKEIQVHRSGKVFSQRRMVNVDEAAASRHAKKPEEPAKPRAGKPGQEEQKPASPFAGKVQAGDTVSFEWEGTSFTGKAAGSGGKDGLRVLVQGMKYEVPWEKVQKVEKPKAAKPKTERQQPQGSKEYIEPSLFKAADFGKQWIDEKATPDQAGVQYILDSYGKTGKEIAEKINEITGKLKGRPQTIHQYRISGEGESARYIEEREKLHGRILNQLLSPDKLRTALPPSGEKPIFMILGGRGGSGKSWFDGKVYDKGKYLVLDADAIKAMLPEFAGWNASDVHEESSDILEQALSIGIRNGLNVVLDGTMKTATSAMAKVLRMKAAGYRTEAHYMHLPPQEAAKRAIGRFQGKDKQYKGRYVPVEIVLKNTTNEASFDQIKDLVDDWSFRDNNVKMGEQPILISQKNGKK